MDATVSSGKQQSIVIPSERSEREISPWLLLFANSHGEIPR
jgi:hypothetical protein